MGINAQTIVSELGIPMNVEMPLPYGLSIELSGADTLTDLFWSPNEEQAINGLMGICQGVALTISELGMPLASLIVITNSYLGTLVTVADRGIITLLSNIGLDISGFITEALGDYMEYVNNVLDGRIQIIEFKEIVPLWWKIVNSKMIYAIKAEYQQTEYSIWNGLDNLVFG